MKYMNIYNILSVCINLLLILIILLRSPNEQSLQEILGPLPIFENSNKAKQFIDKGIQILTILYFIFGIFFYS
uniref:hypothetical protein n=1 Tax=Choristocarpus tenellus TaxID=116065 RepID=UPI002E76E1D0|nr:hypothetical protein V2478_pgp045 [Choristocarpus tenellus]WAM62370.1 hypothetical protein [Choristocarpus tenellus]